MRRLLVKSINRQRCSTLTLMNTCLIRLALRNPSMLVYTSHPVLDNVEAVATSTLVDGVDIREMGRQEVSEAIADLPAYRMALFDLSPQFL